MIRLTKLIQINNELIKNKKRIFSFKVKFKSVNLDIIYFNLEQKILSIINDKNKEFVNLEIGENYEILNLNTNICNKIKIILNWNDKNSFDLELFLKFLNSNISTYEIKNEKDLKYYLKFLKGYIEDDEKTYFCGTNIHNKDDNKVSSLNLNKTLIFLGDDFYKYYKENNISSCWTTRDVIFNNVKYKKYAERYAKKKKP